MDDSRRSSPRVAATIQVRYKTREDFVLEYARDISLGGLFIASDDPLSEGEHVELHLILPGMAQPLKLYGKIVRSVRAKTKGSSGMGIAFDDIEEFTRASLMEFVRDMIGDRVCVVDRRGKAVRYDQILEIHYDSVGEFLIDYSENLSKNGVFIKTEHPQPIDSIVPMKFNLPNGDVIEVTGNVVHIVEPTVAKITGRPAGMGVAFIHYHGSSQERLWAYIESLNG
jgi:uncharacterized protein (TIGR02266 family)